MNTTTLPLEYQKADEKRRTQDVRAIRQFGHGATTGSMAIIRAYCQQLSQGITTALETEQTHSTAYALCTVIQKLPNELLGLCCLQSILDSIGQEETLRDTAIRVGTNINAELWARQLVIDNPQLAANIERAVRKRHSSLKQRRQAARSAATRAGFNFTHWARADRLQAGGWLVDRTLQTLPLVFEKVVRSDGEHMITITDGAMDLVQDVLHEVMLAHPVMQPKTEPLMPWSDWRMPPQGSDTFNITFLRTIHRETAGAAKDAIRSGQMRPALDAVNSLQGVAWRVNTQVLDVMKFCIAKKIAVPGLPPITDIAKPKLLKPWDEMAEPEQRLWKLRASETKELNRSYVGQRILLVEDMETAERMAEAERFYTPMNCDWRGRVYSLCHFNFQREDRVRALFQFADGEPIGEDGLWWLKVHVANTGDFDRVSKRSLQERVEWADTNLPTIREIARNPLLNEGCKWMQADQPFLFLAACMELSAAINGGVSTVTHLPVSWDGSCSGLQHLCAMTRASEGSLVNLTSGSEPQDVYQTVADIVRTSVEAEADNPLAQAWLAYGIDRKVVKRNVMTYSYSSKKFGMAAQQEEDIVSPLHVKVLAGELDEHPLSHWATKKHRDSPSPAATYIAKHTYDGIETVVRKPAEAMAFLRRLAQALAHEGRPVRWTTPTGIPWINRYHAPLLTRINLYMHDKGVKSRAKVLLATGNKKEIDKDRAANGIAPNFVHALDAAHLMLVVNAAAAEGITALATVHDSFGCLASRAGRFNQIIRAEFVRMYETHDVLTEVFEQSKCDLTQHNWNRLPDVPAMGPLNLREIEHADYCFA